MTLVTETHTRAGEWYNENELRAYPFADDCGTGVPTPVLADMNIVVSRAFASVHVSSLYLSAALVSVGVSGVDAAGASRGLLAATFRRDEVTPYAVRHMTALTPLARGVVVFGDLTAPSADASSGPRRWTFDAASGALAPGVVTHIDAAWVDALTDPERYESATGVIDLSGNPDFTTRLRRDGSGAYVEIALNDGVLDRIASPCNSIPSFESCGAVPVKAINGVRPDAGGTSTLRFV